MSVKDNKLGYKIKTNTGWKDFSAVSNNGKQKIIETLFENGKSIKTTAEHEIFVDWFNSKKVSSLKIGEEVLTTEGFVKITGFNNLDEEVVYDVLEVDGVNRFYANDVLVHNCQFIGKTGTLVESTILRELIEKTRMIRYQFVVDGDIRFYKELDKHMRYLIAIDPSMGVNGDYATMQVFEFPTFIQVAEWMSDSLNQNDQVEKLKTLVEWMYSDLKAKGSRSPEIYWSIENNSVGEGFICSLREKANNTGCPYPQDYIHRGKLITENGNKRLGFTTTKRTKTMACAQLKNLLETNRIIINSKEYVQQLSNFTLKEVNYSASDPNIHDDLITASLTIMLMYLQCRNSLDLNATIMDYNSQQAIETKGYGLPFMFFSN